MKGHSMFSISWKGYSWLQLLTFIVKLGALAHGCIA